MKTSGLALLDYSLATVLVANLGDQQKDINYEIKNFKLVHDPRFKLTMANLLGPPFAEHNEVTT